MNEADLDHVQRLLPRLLGAWAALSVLGGLAAYVAGRRRGDEALAAFGRQSAAWGAVDAAIAAAGERGRRRGEHRPPEVAARRLRRLLWANAVADVGYVAGGVAWARRPGSTATGDSAAVVIQGAFLFVLDVAFAHALRSAQG